MFDNLFNAEPISKVIKERIIKDNASFFANDNISMYIEKEELPLLQQEVEHKVEHLLQSLIIDTDNDHNTKETARRVAKMLINELYSGRYTDQPDLTVFPNAKKLDELYIVGPVQIHSACSHHLVPIIGQAWIGILPGDKLAGLSKFARLAHWVFKRPQIQEEATVQLADLIEQLVSPKGLMVVVKAKHMCMTIRGVEEPDSFHTTSVKRGEFRAKDTLTDEFLSLIGLK